MKAKLSWLAVFGVFAWFTPPFDIWAASNSDLPALCARVGDDDAIRKYSPALRAETVRAFRTLFPDARSVPNDAQLKAQAKFRCMNGDALVCFVGANLPCAKMNASRDNPGASAFCRSSPNTDFVPAFATGHDTIYSYRCRAGRAEIDGEIWDLDARGFAKELWTVISGR